MAILPIIVATIVMAIAVAAAPSLAALEALVAIIEALARRR